MYKNRDSSSASLKADTRTNSSQSISWIHLSDLHLKSSDDFDKRFVLNSLLRDIEVSAGGEGPRPDFIIVSGDVAYTGQSEEYVYARDFFDGLLSVTALSKDRLFIVPGNHDVNRLKPLPPLTYLPQALPDSDNLDLYLSVIPESSILSERLGNYRDFIRSYFGQVPADDAGLSYTNVIEVSGQRVAIMGLDSAWFSGRGDDRGGLVLGVKQIQEALDRAEGADLRIAVVHHSFDWLVESDRVAVEPLLLRCDFILNGHAHQAALLQQVKTSDGQTIIIPSGVYSDPRRTPHSYNFVYLDLGTGRGSIFPRSFSEQRNQWSKDVISYLNAPDGIYTFDLPERLSSGPATLPDINADENQRAEEIRIFLSYAREDLPKVERLYERLKEEGFRPWMDTKDILPGSQWETSTLRAIRDSHFFVFCLSTDSVNRRGYFQKEIKAALDIWDQMLDSDIFFIPVRLDECEIPERLQEYQTADLFRSDGWERLTRAIQAGVERRGAVGLRKRSADATPRSEEIIPDGFRLRATLRGHAGTITRIAWSPDGSMLASPSLDETIRVWLPRTGEVQHVFRGHTHGVYSLAWSPDGEMIASGSDAGTLRVWNVSSGREVAMRRGNSRRIECLAWSPDGRLLASASADATVSVWSTDTFKPTLVYREHLDWVNAVAWSPDGRRLATGAEDNTIRVWNPQTGETYWTLTGHGDWINEVKWSHDGRLIASASNDKTIRLWDPFEGVLVQALQGHTAPVKAVSFSSDDRLLISKSHDNTVRLWRCDTWEPVAVLPEPTGDTIGPTPSVAFHPTSPILATLGEADGVIRIWELDLNTLLGALAAESVQYVNAKVVLLGEGSVGKSGLAHRIVEHDFLHTLPTHGAQFWQIPVASAPDIPDGVQAELTLWDLAGQQDYHLVHVLFIDDLSAALLLFDCSDSGNPFRGVHYWAKVLKRRAPADAFKILVSSRVDICPVTVDQIAISLVLGQYELNDYVRTSAKNGEGVESLMGKLVGGINWGKLPRTTTPRLFEIIRTFLLNHKARKNTLINMRGVWNEVRSHTEGEEPTSDEVDTVVGLLQSQGLVYRLDPTPNESFVLLRPDLINQYASSIIQAARAHPQGIGAVPEHEVVHAGLPFSGVNRLDWLEEKIVLESVVELLIKSDLCFREVGMLVFPSQINLTRPTRSEQHPRSEITYTFSGSVEAIFASLVVRLNHSQYFERLDQWKYAAEFSHGGHVLGFLMRQLTEGSGELEIYFHDGVAEFDRILFIRFVTDHLHSKGVGIDERILLYCPKCGRGIDNREAIAARVSVGELDIPCQYDNVMVMIPMSIEEHYRSNSSYTEKHAEINEAVDRRTREEAEAFKVDQRQYSREKNGMIHILHLSDLHLGTLEDARKYRTQLETDLKRELGIHHLEYLVISGDIADKATPEEYKAAFELVNGLAKRFGLDPGRIIVAPGNHDLNWDLSSESYNYVPPHKLPATLTPEYIPAEGAGALHRDEARYGQRFANFNAHFYKKLYGGREQYPVEYRNQAVLKIMENDRIAFLALNSSWNIDHFYRKRAGINMDALSKALDELQDGEFNDWLKIAVWHHPVTGQEMMNDEFLQLLTANRFQVCMHGHVHEAQKGFYSYDPGRGIHIVGAGTFGAPVKEQVPGIPLQYNLLALDRESLAITVHTRKKEKPDGAWYADARWGNKNAPSPQYTINLQDWTFSDGNTLKRA